MKKLITVILLIVGASSCWGQLVFGKGTRSLEIPFSYQNNFMVVKLNFNRTFPLKFIFDTGAEHTILTKREFSDILRIPFRKRFEIIGTDMQTILFAYLITGIHLEMEHGSINNHNMLVLEDDYFKFEEITGVNIHGILGADIFRNMILEINFQKNEITIADPRYFKPPKRRYQEIPIEVTKNKPYIWTNLTLANGTTLRVKLLLDTGASLALLLNAGTHEKLTLPENVIVGNIGLGLGGILEGFLGRVKALDFGDYTLNNVITNFQDLTENSDTSHFNGRNGIIGNALLNRFNLIIDYTNEKLYLRARRGYKHKFKYDRSGIIPIASGPKLNTFIVQEIIPGSPAQQAGIQQGDEIESVNLIPSKLLSLQDVLAIFQKRPGKKIRLVVNRDGQKLKIQFRLKELI